MQAKISYNKNIYKTLYYHEQKQKLGKAECLMAGNFIKDLGELSFEDKHYHFKHRHELNENVTYNVLHIFLSFHPAEKLSNVQMATLAHEYMREMKLAHQPYLVYRHYDTLHPHMHVVSTYIQKDGSGINLTPADFHHSAAIVQTLDLTHHLIQTSTQEERRHYLRQAQRITYNETSLIPAISNVLDEVLPNYKCTSLEELNAVLRLYNVQAYRGREHTYLHQHHGLVYRVLDQEGRPNQTPIKASLFDSRPTLKNLETLFSANRVEVQRQQHKQRITALLEWNMTKQNMNLPTLEKTLERQQISMVWMEDKERRSQHLYYVDHDTKAVFDGSQLGPRYDAASLRERLVPTQVQEQKQVHRQRHHHSILHEL